VTARFARPPVADEVLGRADAQVFDGDAVRRSRLPLETIGRRVERVGFANSGGLVFVDESAEEIAAV
jgi:hypothetical protein